MIILCTSTVIPYNSNRIYIKFTYEIKELIASIIRTNRPDAYALWKSLENSSKLSYHVKNQILAGIKDV